MGDDYIAVIAWGFLQFPRSTGFSFLSSSPWLQQWPTMVNHQFVTCRAVQRRLDRGHYWLRLVMLDGVRGIWDWEEESGVRSHEWVSEWVWGGLSSIIQKTSPNKRVDTKMWTCPRVETQILCSSNQIKWLQIWYIGTICHLQASRLSQMIWCSQSEPYNILYEMTL